MQDKIIRALMDKLRDVLPPDRAYGRVLQALAWVGMDTRGALPSSAALDIVANANPNAFGEIIHQLSSHEPSWAAFDDLNNPSEEELKAFQLVVLKCREFRDQGLLSRMSAADYLDATPNQRLTGFSTPSVLADLLVSLLPTHEDQADVYVAWDDTAQLTARLLDRRYRVFSQTRISSLARLAALIDGYPMQAVNQGDPVAEPAFVEQGRLRKFVSAVAIPPMGVRYPAEQIEHDLWGRFLEASPNSTVVALQHLLAVAESRVVACVPTSFLFGTKTEKPTRERLLSAGCIQAVIAVSTGPVSLAVLVLSPKGGLSTVRMLDADHDHFRANTAGGTSASVSIEAIAAAIHRNSHEDSLTEEGSSFCRDVPLDEIAAKGGQLLVSLYLLSGKAALLRAAMRGKSKIRLGDVAEIFRPQVIKGGDEQNGHRVLEVGASDLPPLGCVETPAKVVYVDEATARKLGRQVLKEHDIVLTIKGTTGRLGRVSDDVYETSCDWIAGQSFAVIRPKEGAQIPREALFALLRSELGQALLESITVPGTIPFIQTSALEALEIPLPTAEESAQAVALIAAEEAKEREVRAIRKNLMGKAQMLWPL